MFPVGVKAIYHYWTRVFISLGDKNPNGSFGAFGLDVRTLTFGQLTGFPYSTTKKLVTFSRAADSQPRKDRFAFPSRKPPVGWFMYGSFQRMRLNELVLGIAIGLGAPQAFLCRLSSPIISRPRSVRRRSRRREREDARLKLPVLEPDTPPLEDLSFGAVC